MANPLASTISFCLKRFELSPVPGCQPALVEDDAIKPWLAGLAVWPLMIAASFDHVDCHQKSWFKAELAEVGTIIGDGVLQEAESED